MIDQKNPLGLKKIHHVEFYVGNAKQAEFYYRKAFGFSRVGYSGLETVMANSNLIVSGACPLRISAPAAIPSTMLARSCDPDARMVAVADTLNTAGHHAKQCCE